jgi:hypothetical protein
MRKTTIELKITVTEGRKRTRKVTPREKTPKAITIVEESPLQEMIAQYSISELIEKAKFDAISVEQISLSNKSEF